MGLQTYRKKRKFDVTPEPRGRARRAKGHSFVVQKHDARRLHYDFRLELDGVMKSWAVTKGPSLDPGEKRLAIQTEDHPIEYNEFEGTIPEGQYGGGTVMIWDRGEWIPEGDPHEGLKKGHLSFRLEGEKLHGGWHLVRMHGRRGETKEPWLLIKSDDEAAQRGSKADILDETAALRRHRPVDPGNRRRQGPQAGVEFEPQRQGQRHGRRDRGRRHAAAESARSAIVHQRQGRGSCAQEQGAHQDRAQDQIRRQVCQGPRPRRRPAAGFRAAIARHAAHGRARQHRVGARGEVRRLSHPGAARSR